MNSCLKDLRTFARLASVEQALVLRAFVLVGVIRISLWVVSFQRLRQLMRACERVPPSAPLDLPVPRLVWAVRSVSRRVPLASCLTQSLALQFLLSRAGRSSQLHIGVKKDPQTGFRAHAWVESEGFTLLSTPSEVVGYCRLLALEDLSA